MNSNYQGILFDLLKEHKVDFTYKDCCVQVYEPINDDVVLAFIDTLSSGDFVEVIKLSGPPLTDREGYNIKWKQVYSLEMLKAFAAYVLTHEKVKSHQNMPSVEMDLSIDQLFENFIGPVATEPVAIPELPTIDDNGVTNFGDTPITVNAGPIQDRIVEETNSDMA